MNIRVIVNPRAGAGAAGRRVACLEECLKAHGVHYHVVTTQHPNHATQLAEEAIEEGVNVIAAVGGDGTFSEVSQAFVRADGLPVKGPGLALIPSGTGGDLRRSFNFTTDVEAAAQRLVSNQRRQVDLGQAEFTTSEGKTVRRVFINAASFGISAAIAKLANGGPKWLGGKTTYMGASLLAAVSYRPQPLTLSVDGKILHTGPALTVVFANGMYFGGAMRIAPGAELSDGQLQCVVLGDLTKFQAYRLSSLMHRGTHLARKNVTAKHGQQFEAKLLSDATQPVYVELDGETVGELPLRVRVLPAALEVLV